MRLFSQLKSLGVIPSQPTRQHLHAPIALDHRLVQLHQDSRLAQQDGPGAIPGHPHERGLNAQHLLADPTVVADLQNVVRSDHLMRGHVHHFASLQFVAEHGFGFVRGFGQPGEDAVVDRGQVDAIRDLEGGDEYLVKQGFPAFRIGFEIGEEARKRLVEGLAVENSLASLHLAEFVLLKNSFEGFRSPISNCDGIYSCIRLCTDHESY